RTCRRGHPRAERSVRAGRLPRASCARAHQASRTGSGGDLRAMQLEHSFTVPADVEDAWAVLLDVERIAPCMPGATLEAVEGDEFTGSVKVKLGPINLTYKGKARFVEKDALAHRAVIDARGK